MRTKRTRPPGPETCARCGRPIAPEEPAVHTASVDIVGGWALTTAALHYHLGGGGCWEAARREARAGGRPAAA